LQKSVYNIQFDSEYLNCTYK